MEYNDNARREDLTKMTNRTAEGAEGLRKQDLYSALAVFVLNETLRPVLEILDPQSVNQARRAMGLVGFFEAEQNTKVA